MLNLIDEHTRESLLVRPERRWSSAKVIEYLADVMVVEGCRSTSVRTMARSSSRKICGKRLADRSGGKTVRHRARVSMGERLLRIVQLEAAGRVPERRDVRPVEGGADTGRSAGGLHDNTIRPHSSLGYRSPAPETWQTEIKTGYGEVESKVRFPLPHTPDGDEAPLTSSLRAIFFLELVQKIGHAKLIRGLAYPSTLLNAAAKHLTQKEPTQIM